MPYARPTLTDLRQQASQDLATSGLGVNGFLRFAILTVLGWVQAGLAWLHYAYLDWIALQAVPWTATDEYLTGWAALVDIEQEDATPAVLQLQFQGVATTDLPVNTAINRTGDGFGYLSTADATVQSNGVVTVTVQATTAGSAGNCSPGTPMAIASPIPGISSSGTVVSQVTAGTDQETQASLRTRMLQRYAAPPQGGSRSDYIGWALAVPGVTRAWVAPNGAGAGTVVIYTMLDNAEAAYAGFPQGTNGVAAAETRDTPATGDQLTVANAIYSEQPVTALVYSCSPIETPVNFSIANLGANNTAAMQASIQAALAGMFVQSGQVGGTLNPATGAAWPAIDPSVWYAALEAIPGLTQFTVVSPSAPLMPGTGQLFTLGTVTYAS